MCSRIFWNNNKLAPFVARTMDWPESTQPILTLLPRGMARDGGRAGSAVVVKENPAKWASKYGSLIVQGYAIGPSDGVNEHGLAVHLLYLRGTEYGPRNASSPGLTVVLWGQYLLDNARTVNEAIALHEKIQIVGLTLPSGHAATLHLAMEDSSGDSAIIEYLGGTPVVHHGREYTIMTNEPPYDEQLALLRQHDFSKPSMDLPLPGNVNAKDRFQRAAYYAAVLPEPKDEAEAVAGVLAIARNVSVPFGAPYHSFGVYNTEYRTAINLSNKRYFFELTTSPNVIWMDLSALDVAEGAPVMTLDPHNIDLSGNVTRMFQRAKSAAF